MDGLFSRWITLLTCFLFSTTAWGKVPSKVAVFPFEIHSQEKLDFLREGLSDMLLTRMEENAEITTIDKPYLNEVLERPGMVPDEREARDLGMQLGADFAILGSLTKIGSGASIDAVIIDILGKKENQHVFVQCRSMEELTNKINLLARFLGFRILDKELLASLDIRGNQFIETDAIKVTLKSKEGELYSPEILKEDLQRIYQMGYFSDVQIDSEDSPEGKRVTFIVTERPVVDQIRIQGNKNIKTPDIQKALGVKLGRVLDQNQLTKDVSSIRKLYLDKGYLNADINYKLTPSGEKATSVDFYINENEISKIKSITFTGNEHLKARQLKRVMDTREKNVLSFITNAGVFKEDTFQKDLEKLTAFYYNEGYIRVVVGPPTITHEGKDIFISIPVQEGSQYHNGKVTVSGDLIVPKETLAKDLKTIEGKVFRSSFLNKDMVSLSEFYTDQGYANVDITPLTVINDEQKMVDVDFEISKGEKIYFEKITITGNTRTRDKVIRRELKMVEGDLYSTSKIKRSRQELENLGYFKKVNLTTSKGSTPTQINLNVEVEEKPTGALSFGAGYSSVDKLVGMIQLSQDNFRGKGQRLDLRAQLGGTNRFMFSFTEPWLYDTRWKGSSTFYNMERFYEDFDSESTGGNLGIGHPLGEFTKFDLGYEYEEVDISDVDDDAALEIIEQEGTSTTGALLAGITRSTLDNRFTPRQGTVTSLSAKFAGLGGDNYFSSFIGSASKFFPLPWDTALMIRGTIGYSAGYNGRDVPIHERFFLGGLDSMRGFDERSLGPRERRGKKNPFVRRPNKKDVIGGEKELFFNLEYLFPILHEAGIRGVIFFDAGNAYRQSEGWLSDVRTSAGFGIRWQSPFGPLRVEWGLNLNPKDDEDTSRFHFTMGTLF